MKATVTQPAALLKPTAVEASDVRVYQYGCRVDKECRQAVHDQLWRAHVLYNDLVAEMRRVYDEMQAWVMERAGARAAELLARIERVVEDFAAARAAVDNAAIKRLVLERRSAWAELSPILATVRKAEAKTLNEQFYSRIGTNSSSKTYQLRCAAVADGLGWATANATLQRALTAWKMSMKRGKPPQFERAGERPTEVLSLQFTVAGGVESSRLLAGGHSELDLSPPAAARVRSYGGFAFRLGPASSKSVATGTWQYHRALPEGSRVLLARLVAEPRASKTDYRLQFVVRLAEMVRKTTKTQGKLVCLHLGWDVDATGRRIAGIADAADPGLGRLLVLPADIEHDLRRTDELDAERSLRRDQAVDAMRNGRKKIERLASAAGEEASGLLEKLMSLRAQHIAPRSLYRLDRLIGPERSPAWLRRFVRFDRQDWERVVMIDRRARRRRRHFYYDAACDLARRYSAVAYEPLDLRGAAKIFDEQTGERTPFNASARSGRVVAAVYELVVALERACSDHATALFKLEAASTIDVCAHCGAAGVKDVDDTHSLVQCDSCGAVTDRKLAGAARAWQIASVGIEDRIVDWHAQRAKAMAENQLASSARKQRMAAGRAKAGLAKAQSAKSETATSGESG